MIYTIIIVDYLLSSLTPFNIHLIGIATTIKDSIYKVIPYFIILSLFEIRFLFNLVVFLILYFLNALLEKNLVFNKTLENVKTFLFYFMYFSILFVSFRFIG